MAEPGTMPRVLLDRYELRDRVGVGGMGEVWLGWDRRLQRDVAVKLLLPQLSDEPAFRQRFEVEARAAAALEHPNVVRVFDIDEDNGALFIVMERLPGPSLDRRIYEGPMSEEEVVRVAQDMLSGLAAAHAENLVHRDIKPGNLIRSAGGRWKVGDFGVAKDLASTAHLTLVGVAVGTPAYLAPEQLDGRPATSSTDLWAAGVVLREALTGRRPFDGNDPIEVAHAVRNTVVPPLATVRPDVSPALAGAIDRSLSFDPRQRFATAEDMLAAIEGRAPVFPPAPVVEEPAAVSPVDETRGLPPLEDVPAPPPSVSGEVPALAPAEPAAPAAPVPTAPAGDPPSPAPPVPPVAGGGRSATVRIVAIAGIVVGSILLLFLLGLLFGLVMIGRDGEDDTPSEDSPATTVTTTEGADASEAPPTTGSSPGSSSPGGATTTPGLLPGDGPLPGGTTEPKPDDEAPDATAPRSSTPAVPPTTAGPGSSFAPPGSEGG